MEMSIEWAEDTYVSHREGMQEYIFIRGTADVKSSHVNKWY